MENDDRTIIEMKECKQEGKVEENETEKGR